MSEPSTARSLLRYAVGWDLSERETDMTLTKYVKNFGLPFQGQEDFRECYLACDVDDALVQARAEGRREERDAWMRKFPVAIPPGEKERPEQGEQCPSCYAVRATWITGCTNPIHPKEGV